MYGQGCQKYRTGLPKYWIQDRVAENTVLSEVCVCLSSFLQFLANVSLSVKY